MGNNCCRGNNSDTNEIESKKEFRAVSQDGDCSGNFQLNGSLIKKGKYN